MEEPGAKAMAVARDGPPMCHPCSGKLGMVAWVAVAVAEAGVGVAVLDAPPTDVDVPQPVAPKMEMVRIRPRMRPKMRGRRCAIGCVMEVTVPQNTHKRLRPLRTAGEKGLLMVESNRVVKCVLWHSSQRNSVSQPASSLRGTFQTVLPSMAMQVITVTRG